MFSTGNPVISGSTISSTWANNTLSDIAANGLTMAVLKDGSQTITANLPIGGFKLTGLGAGTTAGDSVRYEQVIGAMVPLSTFTTAGDIIQGTGAGAVARLGIGTAGQVLAVNAGATAVEWGTTGIPTGTIIDFAGASTPSGYLPCNGAAVSRSTYSALFTAISTIWGAGDGSTTFNVPNLNGRTTIGDGTGTVTEDVTATSSNGFTVVSNNTKWITGMAVVLSNLTGFTTSATAGPTYYAVRVSATNVRLATTLALAQAGTPDITASGTGTATLTTTFTARTQGANGGEEGHAQSSTELYAHTHPLANGSNPLSAASGGGSNDAAGSDNPASAISTTGGNVAANIMQPFGVVKKFIKT